MIAERFILYVKGEKTAEAFTDILHACDKQRALDPKVSWVVRESDGAILKIRNGTTNDLKRLLSSTSSRSTPREPL